LSATMLATRMKMVQIQLMPNSYAKNILLTDN